MIFCRNNCKEYERRSQRAKRSSKLWNFSGLRNFAAQNRPLRKRPSAAKSFRSPYMASAKSRFGCENGPPLRNKFRSPTPPSAKIFAAVKTPLGTRVPFRNTGTPFRSCKMAAKSPKHQIFNFRSDNLISQGVSQLRSTVTQFRNCEMGCEKGPPLRKCPFVAKSALLYEN